MVITKEQHQFDSHASSYQKRKLGVALTQEGHFGPALTALYIGISGTFGDNDEATVALSIHDSVYLVDFAVEQITLNDAMRPGDDLVAEKILSEITKYEHENFVKFVGAGLSTMMKYMSPSLCSRLWLELDIVPIVMRPESDNTTKNLWDVKLVDEQADSMARKCIMRFGPSMAPLLQVGHRGIVQTDSAFRAHLLTMADYKTTCGTATWEAILTYAGKLRDKGTKIAFFSSTPQGGGVALMRHALVRFSRVLGVDLTWYVPKPRPGVFRITKNIHNILQGVSPEDQRITDQEKESVVEWIVDNAHRYWLSEGGPLRPPEEGGADVIVVDDPQMPGLIPLIKRLTPNRPVLYRSHIQIRSDLIEVPGSPQADIWDFIWSRVQLADMFHQSSDPKSQRVPELAWPKRRYIAQVARFDPSKGIPTVIDAYAEFRRLCNDAGITDPPQLCICGNGSIDDPDASAIFDQAMEKLEDEYPHLIDDCSVIRLEPNDQLLNAIIANAHVVLQLSTREGFEVKVSEALHAGRPVIATLAGGIPLQVQDGINGFLVKPSDWRGVARHLIELFGDEILHRRMSDAARKGVSDEVGTVGNALSWYYLANEWVERGPKMGLSGGQRWVNDMAREKAEKPYVEGENRLPREFTKEQVTVGRVDHVAEYIIPSS
ncbi:trehalose synthase (Ccg-9) [Purpureocillium lilacinum]|uniref:Trehalose synthase (Ccg-9) n=1 Tax=Purpureocillium lilacinum TaxID=33203 RepID=A0A179HEM7_PURLI|nr:trehalose synthase (Ccg-9) [Purpureocillium lilacinum]